MRGISSPANPLYFVSGSNRIPEIKAFGKLGQPFGIAVPHLSPNALDVLCAQSTVHPNSLVFGDTGAYSEVNGALEVVAPMGPEEWAKVLRTFKLLAKAYRERAYLVGPDRVGSQPESLERLAKYRQQVWALQQAGANVIGVVQRGPMSQRDYDRRQAALLNTARTCGQRSPAMRSCWSMCFRAFLPRPTTF